MKSGQSHKGARQRLRLSEKFLESVLRNFDEYGEDAVKLMVRTEPIKFCIMLASLLPKEIGLQIQDNRLADLDDTELDNLIDKLRHNVAATIGALEVRRGKDETAH